jgi:hypothetical protein
MRWIDTLDKTERNALDRLDAEIAALRMKRYKMQNAATKRAAREKDAKRTSKAGRKKSVAQKARRTTKPAKGRPSRARPRQDVDAGGNSSGTNTNVGSGT